MKEAAQKIYEFMNTVEKLCYERRDILRRDGVKEPDSDHIMKLCFLLLLVIPYVRQPIDRLKALKLALVHDLVEADAHDVPRILQTPEVKALKKVREMEVINQYRDALPPPVGQEIYDLFMEFEERKTPESKLVKMFDKYEGDIQAFKENFGLRFFQLRNGAYEQHIKDYLRKDLADAEAAGEPFIAELQKIHLDKACKHTEKLRGEGLLK